MKTSKTFCSTGEQSVQLSEKNPSYEVDSLYGQKKIVENTFLVFEMKMWEDFASFIENN